MNGESFPTDCQPGKRERERKERDKSMNQDKTHGQRMKSGGHVAKIRIESFI